MALKVPRFNLRPILENDETRWGSVILLLLILTVAFRTPMSPHEVLGDTYGTHFRVKRILINENTDWSIDFQKPIRLITQSAKDPQSGFKAIQELSPFSREILVELGIAIISLLTGLDIEAVNFVYPLFLSVLGLIGIYLMSMELTENRYMSFASAFFFSISPLFIRFTFWAGSTRHLVTALLPFFVYLLLKYEGTKLKRYFVLAVFIFVTFSLAHQMYLLAYVIWIAYFLAKFLSFFYPDLMRIKEYFPPFFQRIVVLALPGILILSFIVLFYVPLFSNQHLFESMRGTYRSGMLLKGSSWNVISFNMFLDYFSKNNIFLVFSFVGLGFLLRKVNESFKFLFMTLILLFCTPLLFYRMYATLFVLPFTSLLTGIGMILVIELLKVVIDFKINIDRKELAHQRNTNLELAKRINIERYIVPAFIILCIVMSVVFSNFIRYHDLTRLTPNTEKPPFIMEQSVQMVSYMERVNSKPEFIFNDRRESNQVQAFLYDEPGSIEKIRRLYREGITLMVVNQNFPEEQEIYGDVLVKFFILENEYYPTIYHRQDKIYDNNLEGIWSLDAPFPVDLAKGRINVTRGIYGVQYRDL
ncbi:hypothetical protein ACFLRC_03490 [Candidatus Altiarchaeota archaeon]